MTRLPRADTHGVRDVRGFHDQFLLSRAAMAPPDGWQVHACAGWSLAAHPSLPVLPLRTAEGTAAGFALGHLIDRNGHAAHREVQLPAASPAVSAVEIEQLIYSFGGRFACAVILPEWQRLYLDPLGTLALVWCPERRRAASTPTLLLHDEPDHPVFRLRHPPGLPERPNQFYPAGLTAVAGVNRLVPNHYLDLRRWTMTRHHPAAGAPAATELPAVIAGVHDVMHRQARAVVEECGGAYIALTAGKDSRRVLACARDVADRIECFTLRHSRARLGSSWDVDVRTAARVAARAGVRHRIVSMGAHDRIRASSYLLRTGFSGGPGKATKFAGPPLRYLDLSRGWMTGHGGGLCAASYTRRMPAGARLGVEDVLRVLRLRNADGFGSAVERWLGDLPDLPPVLAMDLMILEHQAGSWIGPHLYGTAPFRMNLLPVNHRDLVDAVFGLPLEHRTSGALDRELLRRAWPALLDVPINDYAGMRRWAWRVRTSLGAVRRRARRILGGPRHPQRPD